MRSTVARILLSNLVTNYLNIRKKVTPSKVLAVVKADAYGHGVDAVVNTLNALGEQKPDYFGVAFAEEGMHLRELGVEQPVLLFENVTRRNIESIIEGSLIPTVCELSHLELLKEFKQKTPFKVQIKVNTGMNRIGVDYTEALEFIELIQAQKEYFQIDGIYTHFSTADELDKEFTIIQNNRFKTILSILRDKKIPYGVAHAANSGAILDLPETYYDMVRPGIALYGYYPSCETSESISLKPVMEVVSEVASLKRIKAGEPISYGRSYYTVKETNIVSIPIGYADGFNRMLSNKINVIIAETLFPVVGRVTMDRIMADVNDNTFAIGEEVVLIGKRNNVSIDAWDWAKAIGAIPYEITCTFSKRMPREYI